MNTHYKFSIRPLAEADGGGFVIEYPDLPGCASDGDTPEEALANGKKAVEAWIIAQKKLGRPIPKADLEPEIQFSGKILLRVSRSIHRRLASKAKEEEISVNSLICQYVSEGIGRDDSQQVVKDFAEASIIHAYGQINYAKVQILGTPNVRHTSEPVPVNTLSDINFSASPKH